MDKFEKLIPLVNAVVTVKIPNFTITDAIREAVRKFCKATGILEEEVRLNLTAEKFKYDITLDGFDVVPVDVTEVRDVNGLLTPVKKITKSFVSGEPRRYSCPTSQTITFDPIPRESKTVMLTVAVCPSVDAKEVGGGIIDTYAELLRHGTLSVLLNQHGYAWTDPAAAQYNESVFQEGINDTRIDLENGFTDQEEFATGDKW